MLVGNLERMGLFTKFSQDAELMSMAELGENLLILVIWRAHFPAEYR